MSALFEYAKRIVQKAGKSLASGQVFAKVLTRNDDSGRHGVLIPTDAYAFFPELPISDPTQNATQEFLAFDTISAAWKTVAFKYYERYPERRITRVHGVLNDLDSEPRLFVVLYAKHADGTAAYYFDCANSEVGGRFEELFEIIFGREIPGEPGRFVLRPVDSPVFKTDATLEELLTKFDAVKALGWVDSRRIGDTGIGYTFENLIGIKENNDQLADFKGIEIKCQGIKPGQMATTSKINLFQVGPTWFDKATTKERIRMLGSQGADGRYSCYSQVSTASNNIGLLLEIVHAANQVNLQKNTRPVGYWPFSQLESRLAEKHSRAAFVKAKIRNTNDIIQFSYEELIYCERPSLLRFIELIDRRNIVFEFTMSEKPDGSVRNHGYPWRLMRAEFLDRLFAFQIKLR
jgi:hypothetical protein